MTTPKDADTVRLREAKSNFRQATKRLKAADAAREEAAAAYRSAWESLVALEFPKAQINGSQ